MTIQNKIYTYFDRDPELKVLFVFDDEFIADELQPLEWKARYRYVEFQGDWFTTKYHLDTDWADEKVVLLFHQPSPLRIKSLQEKFPLMDVLTANAEYHHQDYTAFMQQYHLPPQMTSFVEKNIAQLQADRMMRMLSSYYADGTITEEVAVRAFISSYMGTQQVLDWDTILVRLLLMGRKTEQTKRTDFYSKLRKAPLVSKRLEQRLVSIFGVSYEDNTLEKVSEIVIRMKYNAIVQKLAPVEADNYRRYRITNTLALEQINRILALALSQDKSATAFMETIAELGSDIRDEKIVRWYGADANYYYMPEQLCVPVIQALMSEKLKSEPKKVIGRLEEIALKPSIDEQTAKVIDFAIMAARFYERLSEGISLILDTPDEYVERYASDYYLYDQFYRQATEAFYKISPSTSLYDAAQVARKQLDRDYAKYANQLNMGWMRCVKEAGGMTSFHQVWQQDFYSTYIAPAQKKVAVIVSDALRYEVAEELIQALAKRKHVSHINAALATLPTETKYCKPALLPHKEMFLYAEPNGEQQVAVDHAILNSMPKRTTQLEKYRKEGLCVDFSEVESYERERNREIFKHPVVYVFHDRIDRNSHEGDAEDIVKSCRDAIREIETLAHKILESYNVTEVYITADHGFLFNNMEFADKDKHKVEEEALEKKSRYYLTKSDKEVPGMVKFPLHEVSDMSENGVRVATPIGTNRLAAPSGGYMFTHGGASLQEMVIPIIVCHQERTDSKQPVSVTLLDRNLSMQASRLRFKLLQSDAVSMDKKERVVTCALYYNEQAVTPVKQILFNKTDQLLDNRRVQVDLTLNQHVEAKVLQLKVYDVEDTLNPLIKENVTNNTLIENDFDY
ncbi:MAG: PglZ domain-containing protein [Mediterranea sp.]|jgi:hypothetical protein|nr:PglZ domain-containing protein [Mediterranea sp.]